MSQVLHLAGYRFVRLDDPASVRERMFGAAAALGIKGTILLATEGINFNVAGAPAAADDWLRQLADDARLAGIDVKRSSSAQMPFRHLRVKVKAEIIRMNRPAIAPHAERAPAVTSDTLVRWLRQGCDDEGRELALLDTRNAFEVDAGTFDGAMDWRLGRFSEFPQAVARHADALRDRAVVSFCTGGIRCEKAALVLREAGLRAWQLEGGILRYFDDTRGAAPGWRGSCVVFDDRGRLDPHLQPVPHAATT